MVTTSAAGQTGATQLGGADGANLSIGQITDLDKPIGSEIHYLDKSFVSNGYALSSAVEKRDPYTAGHQERVMQLSCAIAREMKLTDKQIGGIRMAAVIHDIGKLNIPIDYLTKPTKLSEAEMSVIKAHPKEGYEILQGIQFPWPIAEIVLQHHERLDGSGYPNGLSGEKILLEAKIIAVADVIEAMATNRPYRPMLGMEKALHEITSKKGTIFDPAVVDACVTILKRDKLFWKTE